MNAVCPGTVSGTAFPGKCEVANDAASREKKGPDQPVPGFRRRKRMNLETMKAGPAGTAKWQSKKAKWNCLQLSPQLRASIYHLLCASTPRPRCEHRDQDHDGADEQDPGGVLSGEFPRGVAFECLMAAATFLGVARHRFAATRTGGVEEVEKARPERVHPYPTPTRAPRFAGRLDARMGSGLSFSPVRDRKLCERGTHQSHDQSRLRPLF